jgi:bisphosphoglycerate-dependent phosphoglycerate mutase
LDSNPIGLFLFWRFADELVVCWLEKAIAPGSDRKIIKQIDMNKQIITGIPLVYELDENLKPTRHDYLGDAETGRR